MTFMPIMNTCSTTERSWHAALVHETAKLVVGAKLESFHTERHGRCALHGCGQPWPCDGRRFAEQVIAAQGG
jgi:hypothetical protein